MQPVVLKIEGIKCDNPDCDFKDDSVVYEDYKVWLNKPCPKCGTNLLTEADLKAVKNLRKFANIVNFFLTPFIKPDINVKRKTVDVEMNGTGTMQFKGEYK